MLSDSHLLVRNQFVYHIADVYITTYNNSNKCHKIKTNLLFVYLFTKISKCILIGGVRIPQTLQMKCFTETFTKIRWCAISMYYVITHSLTHGQPAQRCRKQN